MVQAKVRELLGSVKNAPTPIFDVAESIMPVAYTQDDVIGDAVTLYCEELDIYKMFVVIGGSPERTRYTVAHEIGHFVLDHFRILQDQARRFEIKVGGLFPWSNFPEMKPLLYSLEREADIFAAEMLMPVEWLHEPVDHRDFREMRQKLFVSKPALINRLDETGIMKRDRVEQILLSEHETLQ